MTELNTVQAKTSKQNITPEHYDSLSLLKLLSNMFHLAGEKTASIMRRCLYLGVVTAILRGVAFVPLFYEVFYQVFHAVSVHTGAMQGLGDNWGQIWQILSIFTVLMLVSSVTDWFSRDFDYNGHATLMGDRVRRQLDVHLRNLPLEILYSKRTGEMNTTVVGEVDEIINYNMNVLLI